MVLAIFGIFGNHPLGPIISVLQTVSVGLCCCFCYPCVVGMTASSLDRDSTDSIVDCLLACFVPCLSVFRLRQEVRRQGNIKVRKTLSCTQANNLCFEGDTATDVKVSLFCCPCAVIQNCNQASYEAAA